MSLDIGVPGGTGEAPGGSVRRGRDGLRMGLGSIRNESSMFGIHRDRNAAVINVFPVSPRIPGWTVYTFKENSRFLLRPRRVITADVLLLGGGGSGGGGLYGGGGGAGGFVDKHEIRIEAGVSDGEIVVGEGGAPSTPLVGYKGEPSSFADLVAEGGGWGGGVNINSGVAIDGETGYEAGTGASGGGAFPFQELIDPNWMGDSELWGGDGALADYPGVGSHVCGTGGPPAMVGGEWTGDVWDYAACKSYGPQPQGHNGGAGYATNWWWQRNCGAGGGANLPGFDKNGGLGRPCDIAGWGPLWKDTGIILVPWYCGGGAGAEKLNNWGYLSGYPGAGGGGEVGGHGTPHTGGGGGGIATDYPDHAGTGGGSGLAVVRIRKSDEPLVAYPVPIGYEDVWDPLTEMWVNTPIYPEGITVTHLPEEMTHNDEMGTETFPVWEWGGTDRDHYGWDGRTTF